MTYKLFSVIIPAYNAEKYLRNAIESVLAQTFKDYEVIVVDDGSTDGTASIASSFGNQITLIRQENKGLGGARNRGILAANGELIGLLDADDEWKPNYLEKMLSLIKDHSDGAVYYSSAHGMDASGNELNQIFGRMNSSNGIHKNLLRANFIIPSTVIFRRSVILDAGMFEDKNRDIHGCEDWDLWLRLSPLHKFVGTTVPLVRYRLHADTFSANPHHMQKAVKGVMEKNFGLDDGKYADWSLEKKRAFGGFYRYQTISFVQRQKNWQAAGGALQKALLVDPSLALDLELFYELGLGSQQEGFRGFSEVQDLNSNATKLQQLVSKAVEHISHTTGKQARGTTYYALGLLFYNLGTRSLFRKYFARALLYRPELILNTGLTARYFKSFLSKQRIQKFQKQVRRHS